MEKSEMMKKYEQEKKKDANDELYSGSVSLYLPTVDYIEWLESKAAAYDRLMSCGLSMKELANILKHPVAIDNDEGQNMLYYFGLTPHIGQFSDGTQFWSCKLKWRLPRQLVNFNGDWTTSLTLPDGWEDK